jgi:hypothetical protein
LDRWLVLTLNELLEVSSAVRSSVLYRNSVEDLSRAAMALAGRDPGAGDAEAGSQSIVTQDKDLLRPGYFEEIEIIRPADFLKRFAY